MTMLQRQDGPGVQDDSAPGERYRNDAASYVAAMIAELRLISGKAGFEKLVSALDAAYYEAYHLTDAKAKPAPGEGGEKSEGPLEPTTT